MRSWNVWLENPEANNNTVNRNAGEDGSGPWSKIVSQGTAITEFDQYVDSQHAK